MYIFSDVDRATRLAKRLRKLNPARASKDLTLSRSKELVARAFGYKNWYELRVATEEQTGKHTEPLSAHDYEHAVQAIADYWELPQSALYLVGTEIERLLPVVDRGQRT